MEQDFVHSQDHRNFGQICYMDESENGFFRHKHWHVTRENSDWSWKLGGLPCFVSQTQRQPIQWWCSTGFKVGVNIRIWYNIIYIWYLGSLIMLVICMCVCINIYIYMWWLNASWGYDALNMIWVCLKVGYTGYTHKVAVWTGKTMMN